jgi:transcription elongation factor Elf1
MEMVELRECYFCGAEAPRLQKEKGIYKLHCSCGAKIEYYDLDMVVDMWNYHIKEETVND